MIKFEPILKSLKEILQSKKHFSYALSETSKFYSLNDKEKEELKSSVVSILKNYQKLSYEASYLFPLLLSDCDELLLTMITIKFIRDNNDLKKVHSAFISSCSSFRLSPDIQNSFDKIEAKAKKNFFIEERVKYDPVLYNSLQLELPSFFLKKLQNEYTKDQILFLAKKLHRCELFYFLPNLHKKDYKSSLKQINIAGIDTYYSSSNKEAKLDIEKGNLYPISNVELRAYSSLTKLNYMPNILIAGIRKTFSGYYFDIALDKLNPKITCVVDNSNVLNTSNEIAKIYNLKHTTFIPSSFKLLKTYLASNSFDLTIYKGSCLHIGLSSIHPSILPSLSELDFEISSEKQLNEMITISDFVNKNGYLLFMNYSITKDENINIVKSFLNRKKDFELVIDERVVLIEDEPFIGYYALLKKK